ncbi:MAG: ABC transporter permease [Pseudomonadota bacterium]
MRFISLAWRNTRRNSRRTLLTLIAFATGVAALVFAWSMFDGGNAQMIDNMTGNYSGYIQIHRYGYTDDPSVDRTFSAQDTGALKLEQIPGVAALSPRMETSALISHANNTRGLLLVGVDPGLEPSVTTLHRKIVRGRYFDKTERGSILIGKSLAKVLDVDIGGEVAIITQGLQGSIGAARYRVQGLYDTQNEVVDNAQAFITHADAEDLLSSGGQITTVAVKLTDREFSESVVQEMQGRLGNQFEVEGWQQLLPEVSQAVAFHESLGYVFTFILFGVVVIGVTNTVMMSIMERLREFGVLLAIGTSPLQLFRLILYESLLLGLLGFAIGLVIGYSLVAYYGSVGITFTQSGEAMQTMQGVANGLYPHLSLSRMLFIAVAVLIVIVTAALYPAWKTARLVPVQAIHGLMSNRNGSGKGISSSHILSRFMLLTLALRNLTRHSRRSRLTMVAIAFGLGAFIFIGSIANGYYTQIVENSTGMLTGDAQIQHKDFRSNMKLALSLSNGMPLLEDLQRMPSIAGASPRIQTTAMITSAVKSEPIMLAGVDPDLERQVTFLHQSVKEGHYLQKGHDRDIVIGRKLAELLHVKIGERVVVMAQDVDGNLGSEAFVVAGMFYTGGHGFDKATAHITLAASQKMLAMGNNVTSIALKIDNPKHVAPVLAQIASHVPPGDMRLLTWQALLPEVVQMNAITKQSLGGVLIIVLLMLAVVVMNTVLMSVMERTREFGTMLALGSRPGLIVRLVLLESSIMGIIGTLGGVALGILLVLMHMSGGVSMAAHGVSTAIPGITDVVYPALSVDVLIMPTILLPILALVAAFYPALRASRLEPMQAIRNG